MTSSSVWYLVFFFAPPGGLVLVVASGVAIFAAQAVLQPLVLMFVSDTVEYGQWKFGRRNDGVTLSLQPFIYKLGSAVASGIVGWTVIASGMEDAGGAPPDPRRPRPGIPPPRAPPPPLPARLRSHDETARAARSLVVQTQSRGVRGWGRGGGGGAGIS